MNSRGSRTGIVMLAALAACCLSAPFVGCGGPEQAKVAVGAPVTVDRPVSLVSLAASPESFAGETVRLEGTVKAVCQGMGCWVEVQDAKGASFIARSLDESVLLPKDCVGRKIVVQGVVTALPQEAHEEPAEAAGHVCPKPEYVVATQGAMLR
jgi:hypothetical protein